MKKVIAVIIAGALLLIGSQVMAQEVPKDSTSKSAAIVSKEDKVRGLNVYKEYLEEVVAKKKEAIKYISIDLEKKPDAEHLIKGLAGNKKELAKFELKLEKVKAELKELESSK